MKTYKNLYPQICDFATLYAAYRRARCGKRDRVAVASFEFDLERNLLQLQVELRAHTYAPGGYTNFYIHEPKRRLVSAAPFRSLGVRILLRCPTRATLMPVSNNLILSLGLA